jgi:hypothetical protein
MIKHIYTLVILASLAIAAGAGARPSLCVSDDSRKNIVKKLILILTALVMAGWQLSADFQFGRYHAPGYIVYPISFAVMIMAKNLGFSLRFSVIGLAVVYVLVQNLLDIVQYGIADFRFLPTLIAWEAFFTLLSACAVIPPALLIVLLRAIMKQKSKTPDTKTETP